MVNPSAPRSPEPQRSPGTLPVETDAIVVDLAKARWLRGYRRFAAQYPHMATFGTGHDTPSPDGAA